MGHKISKNFDKLFGRHQKILGIQNNCCRYNNYDYFFYVCLVTPQLCRAETNVLFCSRGCTVLDPTFFPWLSCMININQLSNPLPHK